MGTKSHEPGKFRAILRREVSATLLLITGLASALPASAQYERLGFGQFKHTRWTIDDGAPPAIGQMAQTPDGWIWLSNPDGLHRFDGVTFERVPAPTGSPMEHSGARSLMVSRTGELWAGFSAFGGVAVYRHGQLRDMQMPKPPRAVPVLAETPDGAIWASSPMFEDRLFRFARGRWEQVDTRLRLPPGAIMEMRVGPGGALWVALAKADMRTSSIAVLTPGTAQFRELPVRAGSRPDIAFDAGGGLWVSDEASTRLLVDRNGNPPARSTPIPAVPALLTPSIVFDRAGGMWGTTGSVGIFYIPVAASLRRTSDHRLRRLDAATGLTSSTASTLLVDREGSIWIGTDQGLDQFRLASGFQETVIPPDPAGGLLIAGSKEGNVYIARGGTLYLVEPGKAARGVWNFTLGNGNLALCPAHDGGVWLIHREWTARLRGDHAETLPGYRGSVEPQGCAEDRQGRLWLKLFDDRLMLRNAKGWHLPEGPLGRATPWQMIATRSGEIAFTTPDDLARLGGDRLSTIRLDRYGNGKPMMIAAGPRDLLLGGAAGLLRVRGDKVARIDDRRFIWGAGVRTLEQTPQGDTWLISRMGIARVRTADLDRAFEDPRAPVPFTLFDARDGLSSTTQHSGFIEPQSAVGADGRVWFINREGAAFIDASRLSRNQLPPPVAIRSLASGGKTYRDPRGLTLPPGTHAVEIAYAGLSLAVPQRVQLRYRLEGVDDDWVDPGSRRLASYANLGPGRYRFRVIAANNDGVWNETGATLDFTIRPTFFQGWSFRILVGIALLGLLWLAYSFRVRAVAHRIRQRMAERIEDRERIARELHDTLLQSVQSLTLRFQLAVDDLPETAPARPALEDAIDRADRVIAEGRDRVRDLRPLQDCDIEQIIADIVARQAFGPEVEVAVRISGTPAPLDPLALDEVARIASEAVFNIWRHAGANRVEIDIGHGASFTLRFADDGKGIDARVVEEGGKPGHFGLTGMRERARKLSGELLVRRMPAGGTEVLLTVPGSIAYKPGSRWLLPRFGNQG